MRTFEPVKVVLPEDEDARESKLKELLFGPLPALLETRTRTSGPINQKFGTFVLIEAVRRPDICMMLEAFEVPYCCLYDGEAAENYYHTAPYLAEVIPDSDFADWLIKDHWGQHAAVFFRSHAGLKTLRKQFRKFTQLRDPEDDRWYHFRFYAPETARRILPVLDPSDFSRLAKGIGAFIVESADARTAYLI